MGRLWGFPITTPVCGSSSSGTEDDVGVWVGTRVVGVAGAAFSDCEVDSVAAFSGYQGGNGDPFGVVGIGGGVRLGRNLYGNWEGGVGVIGDLRGNGGGGVGVL